MCWFLFCVANHELATYFKENIVKKFLLVVVVLLLVVVGAGPLVAGYLLEEAHARHQAQMQQYADVDFEYELLEQGYLNSTYEYRYTFKQDGMASNQLNFTAVSHHGPLPFSAWGDDDAPFAIAVATAGYAIDVQALQAQQTSKWQVTPAVVPVKVVYGLTGNVDMSVQVDTASYSHSGGSVWTMNGFALHLDGHALGESGQLDVSVDELVMQNDAVNESVKVQGLAAAAGFVMPEGQQQMPDIEFSVGSSQYSGQRQGQLLSSADIEYTLSLQRNEDNQFTFRWLSRSGATEIDGFKATSFGMPVVLSGLSGDAVDQVFQWVKEDIANDQYAQQAALMMILPQLVTAQTELNVDKMQYVTQPGTVQAGLHLSFSEDFAPEVAAQMPLLYASSLQGDASVTLPKVVLDDLLAVFGVLNESQLAELEPERRAEAEATAAEQQAMLYEQLNGWVEQGYVSFTDDTYRTELKLSNMQLMANDQAVPLMQLMQ